MTVYKSTLHTHSGDDLISLIAYASIYILSIVKKRERVFSSFENMMMHFSSFSYFLRVFNKTRHTHTQCIPLCALVNCCFGKGKQVFHNNS